MSSSGGQNMSAPPMPTAKQGFEHVCRYWDGVLNHYVAKVKPGEFYVTDHDEVIMTVLGSCISACIRDPEQNIGGINHFMLPLKDSVDKNARLDIAGDAARYGNWAMEYLINELLKSGAKRRNLEVKLFGGGKVITGSGVVGENNISFIKQYTYDENLNVVAEDLGDVYPRQLLYYPMTGKVKMKKLRSAQNEIAVQEKYYMDSINKSKPNDDVELF